MATQHKGYMFYTEHRYYGESQPTQNLSTSNLRYLNVKQALHDLNHFIVTIKNQIKGLEDSKVILVGCSYAGSIASWFHVMFPGVAAGSWASSAPLQAKPDLKEFKEFVGIAIKEVGGEDCYNRIENAIIILEDMISNDETIEVKRLFKICNNFDSNNDLDVFTFFIGISNIFVEVVQSQSPSRNSIQKACKEIMAFETDVQGLASYVVSTTIGKHDCINFSYASLLEYVSESSQSTRIGN